MENKRPLILISNDDGYQAKGINSLIDMLRPLADLVVCAPDGPRSGYSCAFSAEIPLKLHLQREEEGLQVWSSNGTPVDCVKLGLARILDRRPDMVIGGINHGDNGSVNSHYSGTMGVVMEGCMKYIPSVAFSLCDHAPDADFEPLRPYVIKYTRYVLEHGLPKGVCLNVNFPKVPTEEIKGIRITRQCHATWHEDLQERTDPYGRKYYWLTGWLERLEEEEDTCEWALQHHYISVQPVQYDMTAHQYIETLKYLEL